MEPGWPRAVETVEAVNDTIDNKADVARPKQASRRG
jgi:hypothetical protein